MNNARTPQSFFPLLRHCFLLLALSPALIMTGCVHYPEPRHTYEYVTSYDRMSTALEPGLSLIYVPENVSLSGYQRFIVGNVAFGKTWVQDPAQIGRAHV